MWVEFKYHFLILKLLAKGMPCFKDCDLTCFANTAHISSSGYKAQDIVQVEVLGLKVPGVLEQFGKAHNACLPAANPSGVSEDMVMADLFQTAP